MKLARSWQALTQAPNHVTQAPRRRQIQLLSGLILVLCGLGLIAASLQYLILPNYLRTFTAVLIGLLCLLAAYGLARTGYYRWAALITVSVATVLCFAVIILNPTQQAIYAFLGLCLLLASLLFTERGLLVATIAMLLGATLALPAWGVPPPDHDPLIVPIFLIMLCALLLLFRRHMLAVEQDHQAVLAASEAQFRAFFDQAAVGVAQIDSLSGRFLRINRRYCDITAYSVEEMRALSFQDITHPDDLASDLGKMRQLIAGEIREFSLEKRYFRKDGETVWVMLTVSPMWRPGAAPSTHIAVVQDITDRKRADETLRRSEAQYRTIVETTQEGVWQIDADGATTFVNHKIADMLGYTVETMIGRPLFDFMDEEGKAIAARNIERRRQGITEQHEFKFLRQDGTPLWTQLSTAPLFDSEGGYAGAIAMVTDILERKQAEERERQLNRLLRTITEISKMVVRERSRARLLAESCRVLVEHGEYRMAWIGLADRASGRVQVAASAGNNDGYLDHADIRCDDSPQGRGPTGTAMREGRYVINNDTHADPNFAPWRESARLHGFGASAAFPLRIRAQVVGAVTVYAAQAGAFQQDEVALLNELVEDLGYALQMLEVTAAHEQAERALAQSEENFRALTENANVGILVNSQGKHVFANSTLLTLLGYTLEEIQRTGIKDLVRPDEREKVLARFLARLAGTPAESVYETVFLAKDGREVPAEITATQTIWAGAPAGLIFLHDISERRRTEARMRQLSSALEQTADSVLITDKQGVIEYANPAFAQNTGYTQAEVLGQNPRLVKSGQHDAAFYEKLWQTILAGEVYRAVIINRRKDGRYYYEEKTITPLKDAAGRITHFISTGKDVTERMQTQQQLTHMAQHDALTELPNRTLLLDRLNQAIARARWHKRIVAVLFVDLDRFKTINDTLGHETGDLLLQQLAARFSTCVREGDTVARFGGDEFVILLDDVATEGDIRSLTKKVLDALAPAFDIAQQQLYITASIGISLYPNDGEDATTLLKHADVAMYRAKELGKNTYQFYSADMSARAFERLTLESSLRHALERGELRVHYQPVVDLRDGSIASVEALLRWQHPDFGLVMPNAFIPVLEDTGLIVPAGEWVLATACAQLDAWQQQGWPALRLAVNLSPRQFQSGDLMRVLQRALALLHCPPSQLELEITESMLMQQGGVTLQMLDALHALGVRLAIDDFGTGYSSLSYLRRFPVDTLKIDRSFVRDIPGDPDDSAITTAITVLAQSLKLHVIAEGVETAAQRDFLSQLGCHLMQGYLFSKPLLAEELTHLLETRNPRT